MKSNTTEIQRYSYTMAAIVMLLVAASLSSCSKSVQFMSSTVVPAADGKVKVKKDRNDNYAITVKVENLADPSRLETPKAFYVVWAETAENGTKNLGRLSVNSGFLSKAVKGSLETVSPYKPVRFFITAEDQGDIQYPGMTTVLRTENYN